MGKDEDTRGQKVSIWREIIDRCGRRSRELGAYNEVRENTDSQKGCPFARKNHRVVIRNAYNGSCRPTWRTAPEQSRSEEVISRDPRRRHPSVKPVLESPTSPGTTPPTNPLWSPSSPPSPIYFDYRPIKHFNEQELHFCSKQQSDRVTRSGTWSVHWRVDRGDSVWKDRR